MRSEFLSAGGHWKQGRVKRVTVLRPEVMRENHFSQPPRRRHSYTPLSRVYFVMINDERARLSYKKTVPDNVFSCTIRLFWKIVTLPRTLLPECTATTVQVQSRPYYCRLIAFSKVSTVPFVYRLQVDMYGCIYNHIYSRVGINRYYAELVRNPVSKHQMDDYG